RGETLLLTSPGARLEKQLSDFLKDHVDSTLQFLLSRLQQAHFLAQPLSGLANAWLARAQSLQLRANVPAGSDYADFTRDVAKAIGDDLTIGPEFYGEFNPVRSGYLQLSLHVVDG